MTDDVMENKPAAHIDIFINTEKEFTKGDHYNVSGNPAIIISLCFGIVKEISEQKSYCPKEIVKLFSDIMLDNIKNND